MSNPYERATVTYKIGSVQAGQFRKSLAVGKANGHIDNHKDDGGFPTTTFKVEASKHAHQQLARGFGIAFPKELTESMIDEASKKSKTKKNDKGPKKGVTMTGQPATEVIPDPNNIQPPTGNYRGAYKTQIKSSVDGPRNLLAEYVFGQTRKEAETRYSYRKRAWRHKYYLDN